MALNSTDIDQKLDEMASLLRRRRADALSVKQLTAVAVSDLAQFNTTFAEAISSISELENSDNPVDQLQVAKLAKAMDERASLYAKVLAVKNGIDSLGL